jgi:hypothetical protein
MVGVRREDAAAVHNLDEVLTFAGCVSPLKDARLVAYRAGPRPKPRFAARAHPRPRAWGERLRQRPGVSSGRIIAELSRDALGAERLAERCNFGEEAA